ncbi:MAG: hypothetical protein ABIF40_04655 [archaeon]
MKKIGIKNIHKREVSIGLFTGAVFGMFAFVGTFVGNFLWWFQLQHPSKIYFNGFGVILLFFVLFAVIVQVAIKNLK